MYMMMGNWFFFLLGNIKIYLNYLMRWLSNFPLNNSLLVTVMNVWEILKEFADCCSSFLSNDGTFYSHLWVMCWWWNCSSPAGYAWRNVDYRNGDVTEIQATSSNSFAGDNWLCSKIKSKSIKIDITFIWLFNEHLQLRMR